MAQVLRRCRICNIRIVHLHFTQTTHSHSNLGQDILVLAAIVFFSGKSNSSMLSYYCTAAYCNCACFYGLVVCISKYVTAHIGRQPVGGGVALIRVPIGGSVSECVFLLLCRPTRTYTWGGLLYLACEQRLDSIESSFVVPLAYVNQLGANRRWIRIFGTALG